MRGMTVDSKAADPELGVPAGLAILKFASSDEARSAHSREIRTTPHLHYGENSSPRIRTCSGSRSRRIWSASSAECRPKSRSYRWPS